ncbi:SCO family protein [Bacillus alkalisoli]|uniref:SCO family protein n=1 Tax=Bacillus alkalisoli TaxID=2011008 RepID=UPI0029DE692F|nr:SCO family protein [Bacillus alkalisoli]
MSSLLAFQLAIICLLLKGSEVIMYNDKYTRKAIILILLFGLALFYFGTDGFTAFTAEKARVNGLLLDKPKFPEVVLEDSKARVYPFSHFEGKYVFITFFYTYCQTVCVELEMNMGEVYRLLPEELLGEEVVFLSISFDPIRDEPSILARYSGYVKSDEETWRMARINDEDELNELLKRFGVIVIPDDYGNFAHNSAFYVVNRNRYLVDVLDYKKPVEAESRVMSLLGEEGMNR